MFSGSSHPELAKEIANHLKVELSSVSLGKFPDGEVSVQIQEDVQGAEVFVIQSLAYHPNDYLMELLIMIDALKRASAKSIVAVIPYFGYSRQDRKDKPRVPITAKLVANLIEKAGATRVLTMDLHTEQAQGFFDIPVDHLFARPALISSILTCHLQEPIVVASDLGSVQMARCFARDLQAGLAFVDKRCVSASHMGNMEGKSVVLIDDICSTATTLITAAQVCHDRGSRHVVAALSHGLFVGDALEKLERSPIDEIFVSNTIARKKESMRVHTVSVASIFAEAIISMI